MNTAKIEVKQKQPKPDSNQQQSTEANHDLAEISGRKKQRREEQCTEGTSLLTDPKPLPDRIKRIYDRKNPNNYSEKQKQQARRRKQIIAEKVGWQKRYRHRHQHQADREKQLINFMNGLPIDFDEDEPDAY